MMPPVAGPRTTLPWTVWQLDARVVASAGLLMVAVDVVQILDWAEGATEVS